MNNYGVDSLSAFVLMTRDLLRGIDQVAPCGSVSFLNMQYTVQGAIEPILPGFEAFSSSLMGQHG